MSNQFLQKYAPGTHKVSTPKLRGLIERSVGMHSSAPAAPVAPVGVQAPRLAEPEVARIERALSGVLARAEYALARLDAQQAQQAQAQQQRQVYARQAQAPQAQVTRAHPSQSVHPGGARTTVASWQATSPQGMANAMVAELKQGAMRSPVGLAERKPNTVTVSEAVRRSLERHHYPFY